MGHSVQRTTKKYTHETLLLISMTLLLSICCCAVSPSIVISDAHVSPSSSAGHIKSVSVRKKKVFRPKGRNLLGVRIQDTTD